MYRCNKCKDRGYIEYKELDKFSFRQWTPWKKKSYDCKNKVKLNKISL